MPQELTTRSVAPTGTLGLNGTGNEGNTATPQSAARLCLCLHRVNGRRIHSEPVSLPAEGAVLGSEGLLGERLDSGLHVARSHARIMELCGHWMLSLVDEHMVCAVNGRKVPWGELCTLGPGDSVQMGFTELRVERERRTGVRAEMQPVTVRDTRPLGVMPTATAVTETATRVMTTAIEVMETAIGVTPIATGVSEIADPSLGLCALLDFDASISASALPNSSALRPLQLDANPLDPLVALLASSNPAFPAASHTGDEAGEIAGKLPSDALSDLPSDALVDLTITVTNDVPSHLPDELAGDLADELADADAHLSPEEALLQQLDADFATSATSRALYYQSGQPLDAILTPPTSPVRVVSLLPEEAQLGILAAPLATSDNDFFVQLARPRPLQEALTPIITPPNFSRTFTQESPLSADAMVSNGANALPETASDTLADPLLLDSAPTHFTLEDILGGPLHIDDVLHALNAQASMTNQTGQASQIGQTGQIGHAPALDVLEAEIPPDPLLLLDDPSTHAASGLHGSPEANTDWQHPNWTYAPNMHGTHGISGINGVSAANGISAAHAAHAAHQIMTTPLPSLLQREHYQTDMRSPYTTLSPRFTAKDTEHP